MIVLTLEDIIFIVLIAIAAILFIGGLIFGWIARIGERIIRRGCVGKEIEEEENHER